MSLSLQIQPGGVPSKARWPGKHGVAHPQSSVSSALSSVASISSSSSLLSLDGSSLPPNIDGIAGQVCTFNASVRLDVKAGDPNDMGLPEHELRSDLPWPRPSPGGAVCMTGDPGLRFRSAFSWSVTGNIWAVCLPKPSQRVGCRLASHCNVVAFWALLLRDLTGKLVCKGLNTESAPSSCSSVRPPLVPCLGIRYGLVTSGPMGLVLCFTNQSG